MIRRRSGDSERRLRAGEILDGEGGYTVAAMLRCDLCGARGINGNGTGADLIVQANLSLTTRDREQKARMSVEQADDEHYRC